MLDVASISAAVGVSLSVVGAVGGLLIKAFISPVENQTMNNKDHLAEIDGRIRQLEHQSTEHSAQLDTVIKSVDRLVGKMDSLMTLMYQHEKKEK